VDFVTAELAAEWDELAVRVGASPFHRPGWFSAWWSAFGTGRVEIIQVRRAGALVAVLPVVHRYGTVTSPDNWHTFVFGPVAVDSEAAAEVVTQALERTRFTAQLSHLTEADAQLVADMAGQRGAVTSSSVLQSSPYVAVDRPFDEYLAARDTRWIRQLEKRRRKLAAAGELELTVHDGSERLDELLEVAFRIEGLGWKSEQGTAILSQPDTTRFYTALARWAADRGILRIALLTLDGAAIAADICLEDARSHYFLKTGFDPEQRVLAPGLILRHDMIRRAFELGLESYELLGSAEDYKMRWTDSTHSIMSVRVFPRTAAGTAARAGRLGIAAARAGVRVAGRGVAEATAAVRRTRGA
jgi:CelD/BcsL family acetyltransferase involved in cellulose biosynthesis